MDALSIKVALMISRSPQEVFEAIVDPGKMSNYFISKGSGRMEEGKELQWQFPEMDMQFPVRVKKVEGGKYISYTWNDFRDGTETLVEITLSPKKEATLVTITEKSRPLDETGLQWLKSNTEGWANFLACLKAWLEYGIHLRKDAFDTSQLPEANK